MEHPVLSTVVSASNSRSSLISPGHSVANTVNINSREFLQPLLELEAEMSVLCSRVVLSVVVDLLEDMDGSIEANSSSGDIVVTINPASNLNYSFATASGDVVVDYLTPEDYGFLLEITTGSGSIGGDLAINVEKISRRYLKGTVGSGKATLKIMTASGDVRVQEKE